MATKTIHPRVKKKELEDLAIRITRLCINRGYMPADVLSEKVQDLIHKEEFRKRVIKEVEEENQEQLNQIK
jgi:hypothetical protein